LGYNALNLATTSAFNVAVGGLSMDSLTTSFGYNTAVGYRSLGAATTAYGNTAVGYDALAAIVTTNNNTAFGFNAGSTSTGSNSVMIGKDAGSKGGTGTTAVGYDTLSSSSLSANYLTAVGSAALKNNTTGTNNTALGTDALLDNTTGAGNTSVGMDAGIRNSTGSSNTSLGYNAGSKVTGGSGNTIIGRDAGAAAGPATTSNNTLVGYYSGRFTPGTTNTLVGYKAGYGVSGSTTTAATDNAAFGGSALEAITTGEGNTAIGKDAGLLNSTGTRNTYLGNMAGDSITTGNNNTIIGAQADASSATVSNEITLGNASVTSFRIPGVSFYNLNGNVGIGTASPSNVLTVTSATQYKGFTLTNGTNTVAELLGFASGNDSGGLKLHSGGAAKAEVQAAGITYFNGGNVGIGTSSPAKQLSITKSALATINTLTDGATITPDFDAGQNFSVTLAGNRTLANPTNIDAGQTGSIFITQDGIGSRTLSFGSYWDFAGGTAPTLSTAAGAVDRIDYIVRTGTSIHAVATLNLS
jgi:hypothetical protein